MRTSAAWLVSVKEEKNERVAKVWITGVNSVRDTF